MLGYANLQVGLGRVRQLGLCAARWAYAGRSKRRAHNLRSFKLIQTCCELRAYAAKLELVKGGLERMDHRGLYVCSVVGT